MTAMHDAVIEGLSHLRQAQNQKRALVVLSDGDDNASAQSRVQHALPRVAEQRGGVHDLDRQSLSDDGNPKLMRRLAERSGGLAFAPRNENEVVRAFAEIAGNLRRGYTIGYAPKNSANDGTYRKVSVVARMPGRRLTVRAVTAIRPPTTTSTRREPRATGNDCGERRRADGLLRASSALLIILGVMALGYACWMSVESVLYQSFENRELEKILASAPPPPSRNAASAPARVVAPGSTIGRIEIPRLGVTAIVRAGSDTRTLQLAVGHIPGTAYPGEDGNVGLAGHRDTFFRRLRDIQPDDAIHVVTPEGRFTYRVQRTDIVQPSDTWVLDATPQPVTDAGDLLPVLVRRRCAGAVRRPRRARSRADRPRAVAEAARSVELLWV